MSPPGLGGRHLLVFAACAADLFIYTYTMQTGAAASAREYSIEICANDDVLLAA